MSFIGYDRADSIDIDSIELLLDHNEDVPEDREDYQNWYDDNYFRISEELEALNDKIEDYLQGIDDKYHTQFCPTGSLRIY